MEKKGKKYIFVINPVAGKGKSKTFVPKIEDECQKRKWDYDIIYTEENTSIAEQLKDVHNATIYAVGGDGLISQVLQAVVGTDNHLAVIPAGSGNDFYKTLLQLEDGEHKIDIGKINDQYFINVACLGIDAEVANNIDKLRDSKIPTSQLYNASIVYTFFKYHPKKVDFKTEIKEMKAEPMIISICNGAFYGGGYNIAPKSSLTDGIFDVYYADKFQKFHMLSLLPKLRKGNHEGKRYIHKFRTNHVEITTEEEVVFNVDGEKLTGKHFVLDVVPEAVCLELDQNFVKSICQEENEIVETEETGKLAKWKASKIGKFLRRNFRNIVLVILICWLIHLMMYAFMGNPRFAVLFSKDYGVLEILKADFPLGLKLQGLWNIFAGPSFVLGMAILLAVFAILKGITGNAKASCAIILAFEFIFEILNYIVMQLRGTGITIADVYAIRTAMNVAEEGMSVSITGFFIAGFFFAAIIVLLILALKKPEKKLKIWRKSRFCFDRLHSYYANCQYKRNERNVNLEY